jgi:hypothetical protein
MSGTSRQNRLFAGQDWQTIYQAFSEINFAAYDYDTVRTALIDYIRVNYPEDFNDWIESSEFVAIIEMLAYLAGSLAFRIDLNVRENFMDTATRRESVFRLARYLSYAPRRCLSSQGLLKLQSVRTSQNLFDSNGQNLANQVILWNDVTNPDWLEQFILVLNASFVSTNPFGEPVKRSLIGSVLAERYDMNNTNSSTLAYTFSGVVSGSRMQFEFCNTDFDTQSTLSSLTGNFTGFYKEKTPNVFNSWSVVYRNDGNGNASANTGFFVMFKQGTLAFADFVLDSPIPNRVIDLQAINVNQQDVWVQSVTDSGIPQTDWTRVPAIFSSNLVYNNVNRLTRDIYQVVTRDLNGQDAISIRFGDGNFGNIPTGRIRVYYRTSNNLTYTIQPQDIQNQTLTIGYEDSNFNNQALSLTFGLTYPVANSLSRESTDSIKQRAPAVFYTQNRMVNGEDYNLFPLQNSQAIKVRAVNRVYSGQSRYLELTDPTGAYSNTKVFSDDGILYEEPTLENLIIPVNGVSTNTLQIIQSRIMPLLQGNTGGSVNSGLLNFYLSRFPKTDVNSSWINTGGSVPNASQGQFVNVTVPDLSRGLTTGSWVAFGAPGDTSGESPYVTWANIVNAASDQLGVLSVILNKVIPNQSPAWVSVPPLRVNMTSSELSQLTAAINSRKNFGLRYDPTTITWSVVASENLAINAEFSLTNAGNQSQFNLDASWLVQFLYQGDQGWRVSMRSITYVFESVQDVKFFYVNTQPVVDGDTLTSQRDQIRILKYNLDAQLKPLTTDQPWLVQSQPVYSDGHAEPSRLNVMQNTGVTDHIIQDPEAFVRVVPENSFVFWKRMIQSGYETWQPTQIDLIYLTMFQVPISGTSALIPDQTVVYVQQSAQFLQLDTLTDSWADVSSEYKVRTGRGNLNYVWQHFVPRSRRVDPAIQNIIDVYVLTNSYDQNIRNWISKGRPTDLEPQAPTPEQLAETFQSFQQFKMMTDQLVWHPVKYKLLFGAQADVQLQAQFKVVKLSGSQITDSEIKSRVIQAVDTYFDIANWTFGQSFYFTELAAFIHQQMATFLSSVVIVPVNANSQFGDLFEIRCEPDQLFLSAARVTDVQIVNSLTPQALRMDR